MKSNRAFVRTSGYVIYSRAVLVKVTSNSVQRGVFVKPGLGGVLVHCTCTLTNSVNPGQTPQNAASDQGLHCLLKLQEYKGIN